MASENDTAQSRATTWPVFICYRQSDGRRAAERLFSILQGAIVPVNASDDCGDDSLTLDVYFDQTAPGVSDWTALHEPYLARARAFIVVCTPGAKIVEGEGDWVHREIAWWLAHRDQAPIVIDALNEHDRYVPTSIAQRWPNAQRITLVPHEWEQLTADEIARTELRTRARIIGGITQSAGIVYRQELAREQQRTNELATALATQQRLATWLRRLLAGMSIAVVALLAVSVWAWSQTQEARREKERAEMTLAASDANQAAVRLNAGSPAEALAFLAAAVRLDPNNGAIRAAALDTLLRTRRERVSVLHGDRVFSAAFSTDGTRMVTASTDHTARVWDARTGQPAGAPLQHGGSVDSAAFSADGTRVVTASEDKTARVWDAAAASSRDADTIADAAEAVSGYAVNAAGSLIRIDDAAARVRSVRQRVANSELVEPGGNWMIHWFFEDPWDRTISPTSAIAVNDYIIDRLKLCTTEARAEVEFHFRGHPLLLKAREFCPRTTAGAPDSRLSAPDRSKQ